MRAAWSGVRALLARRAPTIKLWSLDARSEGQPRPLPLVDILSRGRISLDARIRGSTRPSTFRVADLLSILLESPAMPVETFAAQVEMIKDLTHDVRQLDLRLIAPKTITFKPGQFVSFEMPHPQTGHVVTRPYSIASQPSRSDVITLLFNLVPGGPGSTYLFNLKEGDKTHFKGPAGNFYLRDDPNRELLFIGTGTGIAPIRSMLLANAERPDARPATLFWGLRGQRDLYYQEELAELTDELRPSRPSRRCPAPSLAGPAYPAAS